MKKIAILSIILLIQATIMAQDSGDRTKTIGYHKRITNQAEEQINQLKDGALIVRLKTKKNSIEALKKIGRVEEAKIMEAKQAALNIEIIAAFKNNFNFCPTYFIFSDSSKNVKEKDFENVFFLNDSLFQDSAIKLKLSTFFTAEFGLIEADTAEYFSDKRFQNSAPQGDRIRETVRGEQNMNFGALIIKSDQFIQLRKPFPYYVRVFDTFPFKRSPDKTVKLMNNKLHKYYKSVKG